MKKDSAAGVIAIGMDHQWLPFTPNRDFEADPKMFSRAEGAYYYDPSGAKIFDGVSGLFTTPAGHGLVEIADAVRQQLLELDYTPSFLRAHAKSFALADAIADLLPKSLSRIFFVNSGSDAVDTAIKICLLYHRVRKQGTRGTFVSRDRAYHGVNLGGVALAGMVNNRRTFGPPGLPVVHMRDTFLDQNRFTPGRGKYGVELADDLLRLIRLHGAENIAACFVEPIAGSTGVLVPPEGYLERLREICTEHGILLVFDEVICGFGRTGEAFAAQTMGVTPDIITMAKAITNGAVPMGAVAVSGEIYSTIMDEAKKGQIEFFHGYTWSAHPVACAAALAALDIYERDGLFERGRRLSPAFLSAVFALEGTPGITDIRGMGMMAAVDIDPVVCGCDGYELQKRLFDRGLHIKATGNSIMMAPPFISTEEELETMVATLRDTLWRGR
jgi:beta-alanine--pyruvate transaminase